MKRILVVEDESIIAMELAEHLTEMGYDVVGRASSGVEAIAKAKELRPDLILMDIVMPGEKDGIDAAKEIKSEIDVPVIFLTAYADEGFIKRAKTVEPFGYIVKPYEDRELRAGIEIALYKKEMESKLKEEKNRVELLFENALDAIYTTDLDGNFTSVNKAALELTGYEKENIEKKNLSDILTPEGLKIVEKTIQERIKGKNVKPPPDEYEIIKKNGTRAVLEATCNVIMENDKPIGFQWITRDITERRRKEILEAQSELRTILTDAIPVLLMGAPPEKENRFINQMCNSIEDVLWKKHLASVKEADMNILGTILCEIMNKLGGDFEIESMEDRECIIKGNVCPWGTQAQRNPILCMLTKGIFSRLSAKVFKNVAVNLDKTIGNRDDYCSIRIQAYGKA